MDNTGSNGGINRGDIMQRRVRELGYESRPTYRQRYRRTRRQQVHHGRPMVHMGHQRSIRTRMDGRTFWNNLPVVVKNEEGTGVCDEADLRHATRHTASS